MTAPLRGAALDAMAARAASGDRAAEAEALEGVRLLAYRVAGRYLRRHPRCRPHEDDVLQDALLMALEAIRRYDPARGARLSTWVANRVTLVLRRHANRLYASRVAVLPAAVASDLRLCRPELLAQVRDPEAPGHERAAHDRHIPDVDAADRVRALLRRCSRRERGILVRRLGLLGHASAELRPVGAHYDISRERVRQVEEGARRKIGLEISVAQHLKGCA